MTTESLRMPPYGYKFRFIKHKIQTRNSCKDTFLIDRFHVFHMAVTVEVFGPQKECMSASYHSAKIHEIKLDSFGSGNPKVVVVPALCTIFVCSDCGTKLCNRITQYGRDEKGPN